LPKFGNGKLQGPSYSTISQCGQTQPQYDYLTFPRSSAGFDNLLNTTSFTLAFWMYATHDPTTFKDPCTGTKSQGNTLYYEGQSGNIKMPVVQITFTGQQVFVSVSNIVFKSLVASLNSMSYNQWHHVAIRWSLDATTLDTLIDGVVWSSIKIVSISSVVLLSNIELFYALPPLTSFDGQIDELWRINQQLNTTQIAQLISNNTDFTASFPCPVGTYSPSGKYTSGASCTICPTGNWTSNEGSTSCASSCSSNFVVSLSGTENTY
jgi:hypothetical protein